MSIRTNALSSNSVQEITGTKSDPLGADKVRTGAIPASRKVQSDAADQRAQGRTFSLDELDLAVETVNQTVDAVDRALEFAVHQDTNRIMVRVVDRTNDKVIREVPPEKVLDLMAELRKLVGLLVDENA